ncbi:hypothetical protein DN752_17830 [Echinicola strongylocentroti]|uniref:PLD phosphodiesterase domain-containing protein n=1 Tax=Echinicola strongylocentroti TaxID=1795355 RepID=A0A2Z4IL57_9BACT|nr:hypothetical protein [Echinicola strongylocentroti]AWW31841.1 hypothetical protein DN752_17830 [Echinicola strongylocentroti]
MKLFSTNDIPKPIPDQAGNPKGLRTKARASYALGKSLLQLQSVIGEIDHDQCIQFSTGGKWSMHHLLEYLLLKTGPAKVWLTTWTITEEPMRALVDMIRKGLITEINAVLDYRIEKRKPEALQLASNIITNIRLTKCHAKVLVIQNEQWKITVLGSANLSKNPRIEAGVIFTDEKSAKFHAQWIDDTIHGKEVFHGK